MRVKTAGEAAVEYNRHMSQDKAIRTQVSIEPCRQRQPEHGRLLYIVCCIPPTLELYGQLVQVSRMSWTNSSPLFSLLQS